jgi:TIR domain
VRWRGPQSPDRREKPSIRRPGRRSLRVFLSYRREDASGHAGRLYDLLAARYGADRVFMDIDAIPLGSDFTAKLGRAVASSDVFIALIGRSWVRATDAAGHRRLDDPDDFVRREIESALTQGVAVIPTCVQGAGMPRAEDLPPSLAPLTRRQGFQLSDTGWQDDVRRLIRRLEALVDEQAEPAAAVDRTVPARRRWRPVGRPQIVAVLGVLAVVAALAVVLLLRGGGNGQDTSPSGSASVGPQRSGLSPERGTVTLGSDLRSPPGHDRWYCSGDAADTPCTFALTRLPEVDRLVAAPFNGVVTRWQVQWAGGPIRLVVLRGQVRPGGGSTLQRVQGSGEEQLPGGGRHRFRTRLEIRKGDAVGLQLSIGAYGNAPYSAGTTLDEWIPPLGAERRSSDQSGDAVDYELLYNATIEHDRDGDGFGDVTQDRCPKDPSRHEGC